MFQASSVKGSASRVMRTGAGVLVVHLMGWWALSQVPGAWRSGVGTPAAITVFLLDNTDSALPRAQSQPPWHPRQEITSRLAIERVPVSPEGSSSVVLESLPDAGRRAVEAPASVPLMLQLPKGWLPPRGPRHPALESGLGQRSITLESHLAKALGDGHWTEERLGDGRLRLRNGHRCIDLQRNRSDELNPFNATPTPWTAREQAC